MSLVWHFNTKPETYDTDARKIQFAMSYLEGAAKSHVMTKMHTDPGSTFFLNWAEFISEMQRFFGEHNPRGVAQRKMRAMRMGERESFANYIVRFQEVALDTGFNDPAMKSALHQTLNTRVLKMLVTVPEADSYSKLVEQCMTVDQRVDDVDSELKIRAGKSTSISSVPQVHGRALHEVVDPEAASNSQMTHTENVAHAENENSALECFTSDDDFFDGIGVFEEMSLRAAGISFEERKRRRENALCYYCGEKGHFMKQCPKAKNQLQASASARGISFIMPDDTDYNFLEDLFSENY
jgi:hypothetical protein